MKRLVSIKKRVILALFTKDPAEINGVKEFIPTFGSINTFKQDVLEFVMLVEAEWAYLWQNITSGQFLLHNGCTI